MSGIDVPKNMVTATTTVELKVGEVVSTYSTNLMAQTHKLSELEYLVDLAWEKNQGPNSGDA